MKSFLYLFFFFITSFQIQADSPQKALATLDEIEKLIQTHYYRREELKGSWTKSLEEAKHNIESAKTASEQYQVIVDLVSTIQHSHLEFFPPKGIKTQRRSKFKAPPSSLFNSRKTTYNKMGHLKVREVFESKKIDDLLYIHFTAFTFDQVWKVKEAIQKNKEVRGMIIDLRNNAGGAGMLACGIALEFCDQDYSLGTMTGPEMNLKFPVLAQPEPFQGPVVILVNQYSYSTAEILARGMQVEKEATIVGEPTQGLALPSLFIKLSDGSRFQYPIADFKDTTGQLLEAKGVIPDILVEDTPQGDAYLETAIDYLNTLHGMDELKNRQAN